MATKQLNINGATGIVAIVGYANASNAIAKPLENLNDVYFHTSLPYLQLKISLFSTTNFSAVNRKYYSYDTGGGGCGGC